MNRVSTAFSDTHKRYPYGVVFFQLDAMYCISTLCSLCILLCALCFILRRTSVRLYIFFIRCDESRLYRVFRYLQEVSLRGLHLRLCVFASNTSFRYKFLQITAFPQFRIPAYTQYNAYGKTTHPNGCPS